MTLRHVVNWRLAAQDPTERADQAAEVAQRLQSLDGVVESIRALTVGVNAVHPEANWDVCLVADFDDADGLAAYATHPAHVEVASFVSSVVAQRAAVDFLL